VLRTLAIDLPQNCRAFLLLIFHREAAMVFHSEHRAEIARAFLRCRSRPASRRS